MADDPEALTVTRVVRSPDPYDDPTSDRRRQLWRDSATILIGVVIALLAAQTFFPSTTSVPGSSSSELPTQVAVVSFAPPISLAPGATLGPILPSIDIDASPTPIPVITMAPPTPTPEPTVSGGPSGSPGPSPRPSRTPAPTASGKPVATPAPTVPPPTAPIAKFTCAQDGATLTINCTDQSTGTVSSRLWAFGEGATATGDAPSHTYAAPGIYEVTLTVEGPGGTSQLKKNVTVVGA